MSKQTAVLIFVLLVHPTFIFLGATATLYLNYTTDESSPLSLKSRITSDPNNVLSTNWTRSTSISSTWVYKAQSRITCSRRHPRVTSLNLFDMGLQGTIPDEIGSLSFLTFLDIGNNSFSGEIPARIGNLSRLRVLKLSKNKLEGRVPASLGLLRNLEILDLADNTLTGNVPWDSLFNISSLQVIALARNYELSGAFPVDISGASTRLEQLRLSLNKFVGDVPETLSRCRQLKIISFSFNSFTGNLTGFQNLPQLQILALGRNQFSGTISPSIGNLSSLQKLDLAYNFLHGIIPSEIGKLTSMSFLSLGQNRLTGEVPTSIFNLTYIDTLSLTSNNLSGGLPIFIDKGLPNIQNLYLSSNQFSGKIPYSISNLSCRLTSFAIGDNSFSGLIPINLGNLHQLQSLTLGNSHFTNDLSVPEQEFITSLTNCKNLTTLEFSLNPITGVLPKSLGSTNFSASLQTIRVFSCQLRGRIPEEIGNLESLIWLSLEDNQFTGEIPATLCWVAVSNSI